MKNLEGGARSPGGPDTLVSLQAGRGLAALAVAAFHMSIMQSEPRYGGHAAFEPLTRYGYLGVDYFFVLSGFIIAYVHGRDIGRPERLTRYAVRRFMRVWPIYWLYTAVFAGLVAAGFGTATTLPVTLAGWFSSFTLVRLSPEAPPLAVAWTLFHEAAFYAVFGLLIWRRRLGTAVFLAWMLVCAGRLHYPDVEDRTPLNVYGAGYNLDFLLGMLSCRAADVCRDRLAAPTTLAGLCGAGLVIAGLYWQVALPMPQLLLGVCFAVVIAGAVGLERSGRLRVPAPLRVLGDASYTLYLLHIVAIGLTLKIAMRLHLPALIGSAGTFVVALVGSVALCLLVWRCVEQPMIVLMLSRGRRTRGRAATIARAGA